MLNISWRIKIKNKTFISGYGVISSAGKSPDELFQNVINSNTGLKETYVDSLDDHYYLGKLEDSYNLENLSQLALEQSIKSAMLSELDVENAFFVYGTSTAGILNTEKNISKNKKTKIEEHWVFNKTYWDNYKFKDSLCFSTACTSSGNAIKFAQELIETGFYDIVVAGGFDLLCNTTIQGFNSLSVLSKEQSKPFDLNRSGMNIGEGAAYLVLESEKSIEKRQIEPIAELVAAFSTSDAFQITAPSDEGILNAMKGAIYKAGIKFNEIEYINAHGTGTIKNDEVEANSIDFLFDDFVRFSSTKHITGHLLGAASAIESIISINCLIHSILPSNTTTEQPISKNLLNNNLEKNIKYVMSNSIAFGGNNVSLIFGKI